MQCPECQNPHILHADSQLMHFIRMLTNNPKRYCPVCHHKWRIRLRSQQPNLLVLLILFGIVTILAVEFTENILGKKRNETTNEIPFNLNKKALEKAQKKFNQNPMAFSEFNRMSPSERRRLEEKAKKYMSRT